ncbi:MAG TPA: hypothetical protein VE684_18540 [Crenalkalicoccus sp.]|jgi:hypothetical protein|nr:hypothetical protein [Crenalkalicoccus sp.]
MIESRKRRCMIAGAVPFAVLLMAGGCQSDVRLGPQAIAGKTPDGTVEMNMVQAAYIGSGSGGSGVLYYRGQSYPFTVGGAGIGGLGVSSVDASGDVYNLSNISQFPGTYGEARYGFALGTASAGDLWLQNEAGVIMRLKARREGLMLSLGGSAIVLSMR